MGLGCSFFAFFFFLFLVFLGRVIRGGNPTSRKGGGRRDGGHSVTLFLYIDLYFVLLFLSFANPIVYL